MFAAAGVILAVTGFWRVMTLLDAAFAQFDTYRCAGLTPNIWQPRGQAMMAVIAGIGAVMFSEVASRRNAPKILCMAVSIAGVFVVLAGSLILLQLFLPPALNCIE